MTALLLWAAGGLIVAMIAPRLLSTAIRRGVDSQVALVTWAALVFGTLISIVVPVTLSLVPSHGGASSIADVVHQCWLKLHNDAPAALETTIGALGILVLLTAAGRWTIHLTRSLRERRVLHETHIALVRILDGTAATASTLWLPFDKPLAYSVAGRPPLVVVSTGLRSHLDPAAVAAVLAHEHAHIRGRHHLLVGFAESMAFALPWLPIMRTSPALVRLLVEIEADASAASSHGRDSVCRALRNLQSHSVPAQALGMACDGTELRLDRLSCHPYRHGAPVRLVRALLASGTAIALPAVPVAGLLGAMAWISCLLL
ncbi:hypothetical protein CBI38_36195 (plasmid) [Rhodococcus oxybenzonivorans]|uniref:Peptidase M48 domain-containing protein n=1 Tax=Rhodococcus oxybenzonivorans TaxID=1990687 RepID=A0A2S2C7J4_9NOCA|nr:M56 family metallopeptidase [Rhodococcus oxybenzonivorans]AWK76841.1 hypothetical protein CBI38_36195 [Rhodococcus oxybenzonivorans]